MIQAKCIEKFRDKQNKITGYRLQDQQGKTLDITSKVLKQAIQDKQIQVINLKLTQDGRLIDIQSQQPSNTKPAPHKFPTDQELQNIISKARMMGLKIKEIKTPYKHKCYVIYKTQYEVMVLIPSDIKYLELSLLIENDLKEVKVLGGSGLISTEHMFRYQRAQTLDLSSLDTSNVTGMSGMFTSCKIQTINLSSLDTSNVTNMRDMFSFCKVQTLDLSSFDTSNVTDMNHMFFECEAQTIELSSFNTSNVTDMTGMFNCCKAQTLDLSSFDTSNVTNMSQMFERCEAQTIDLSSFNTSSVTNMYYMFNCCKAQTLDLSSFDTSNVTNMYYMFKGCEAQIKAKDQKLLKEIHS